MGDQQSFGLVGSGVAGGILSARGSSKEEVQSSLLVIGSVGLDFKTKCQSCVHNLIICHLKKENKYCGKDVNL